MSFYREQLENYLKKLDIKANMVLDIGGASNPVKKRVKSWNVKRYDIADNCIEKSVIEPTIIFDLNFPEKNKIEEKYDIVFCLEVFEYIYRPEKAIKTIYNCLKRNGIAYITFPFIYPLHNPKEFDYLRYTKRGVEKLLEIAGFTGWKITPRIDKSGLLQIFYQTDGMRCAKGEQHNITGWIVEAWK